MNLESHFLFYVAVFFSGIGVGLMISGAWETKRDKLRQRALK